MKAFKLWVRNGLLVIFIILVSTNTSFVDAQTEASKRNTYLPIVENEPYSGFRAENKFIGINMQQYWTADAVKKYMPPADNLAGKKHSVSGWFIDIQDGHFLGHPDLKTNNLYRQLEALWQNGYISFLNITSSATAYAIASGQLDN